MKTIFTLFLSLLATQSFAQNGTHGGGTAVYKNDQLMLRDLSDKTVCAYRSANTLYKEFEFKQRMDEILTSLYEVHPYMSWLIRREMAQLSWCLTANLHHVSSNDAESVTANYDPQVQVAIRDIEKKKVYLDASRLKQLPLDHQAMTIIHETLHTWIKPQTASRNSNLRSISKMIYDNYLFSRMKNPPIMEDRIINMDVTLAATETVADFMTVEQSQLFKKAILTPKKLTQNELFSLAENQKWLEIIVNQFGTTQIVQPAIDAYLANGGLIAKNKFLAQLYLDQAITWIEGGIDDLSATYMSINSPPIKLGTCKIERQGGGSVTSAGFMSATGYSLDLNLFYKLTLRNGKSITAGFSNDYTNHTILFAIPISASVKDKATPDLIRFKGVMSVMKRALNAGLCDFHGPEYKNFY